jgi:nucleoside-diphosphate-sugar epimerase
MGVAPRVVHLEARHEVHAAHSSHEKIRRVFGARATTTLEDGLIAMADWVRRQGARSGTAFQGIEITKNLPPSWRSQ